MARSKKRRRRIRRAVRAMLIVALMIGGLAGLAGGIAADAGPFALLFVPLGMMAAVIVLPVLLLGLAVALLGMLLPVAIPAAIFFGPLFLVYRLAGRRGPAADDAPASPLDGAALLRRRYVAGELTYNQFQAGMVDFLKDRFARGEMALAEYEAELEKLLEPARRIDVLHDPAITAAIRTR